MAPKTEKLKQKHAEVLKRLDLAWTPQQEQREACLNDRKFVNLPAETWKGTLGDKFENKPKLEMSILPRERRRLLNDWRENRITVDYVSALGDDSDEVADALNGLFRADSARSQAEEAMDNCYQEGIEGGMGGFRLSTEYQDETDPENEKQNIVILPVYEADSTMFFDPNARLADKSDAKYAFLLSAMTPEAYEAEYPDWSVDDIGRLVTDYGSKFLWKTSDLVYVAEYYVIEQTKEKQVTFADVTGGRETYLADDLTDEMLDEFEAIGTYEVSRRDIVQKRVRKYIASGGDISDEGYIAGSEIPLVPFYAERAFVDGLEYMQGFVRPAKDGVRLKNMMLSGLAFQAATSGSSKPIFLADQIAAHSKSWADDATKNYPYLQIDIAYDETGNPIVGPVGQKAPVPIEPAMAALIEQTTADITDILGNQQEGDKYSANLSGKAVELVQGRLDGMSYLLVSNMAKAVARAGNIYASQAADIYVEEGRKLKVLGDQEEVDYIVIGEKTLRDGEAVKAVDFSNVKFDVVADVGPVSKSARASTVREVVSLLPYVEDPNDRAALLATILRNTDGEGMGALREFFRKKMVAIGVEEPTDEDVQAQEAAAQNQQPDPQAQLAQALAVEAQAKSQKAQADTQKSLAEAQLKEAQTAETLAGIPRADQKQAVETAEAMGRAVTQNPPI